MPALALLTWSTVCIGTLHAEKALENGTTEQSESWPSSQALAAKTAATTIDALITDESCPGESDGSIVLTINSSTTIESISWSNGESTQAIYGLAAGDYEVSVTDGDGFTQTQTYTVASSNPAPTSTIEGDATVCSGEPSAPITFRATGGIAPYVAHFSINGGLTLQTGSFTDEITLNQPTSSEGSYSYELLSIVDNNGCEHPVNQTATITVTNSVSANNPGDFTYCQGETTPAVELSGSTAGMTFDISGGSSIGLNDQTNVSHIPSFTALPGLAELTITPRASSCTGSPETFQIEVLARPDLSVSPQSQTICSGESGLVNFSSSMPDVEFNWTVQSISPTGSVTGATDGTGTQFNQQLENNGSEMATVTYMVSAHNGTCRGASIPVIVRVAAPLEVSLNATANTCEGGNSPEVSFVAANGSAPYTFVYTINSGDEQSITIDSGNTATLAVPSDSAGVFTYTLVSATGQGVCSSSINSSVAVTIHPQPELTSELYPQGVCSNEVFTYIPTSQVSGTTFEWTRAAVPGISNPAAAGTDNPDEYLENTTNDPISVTYTYTLTSPDGCVNTQDVVVVVTRKPEMTSSLTPADICSGSLFSYEPTSDISGTNYPWTREAVPGIANPAASGMGNPNEVLINTTSVPQSVTYNYTLHSAGCQNPLVYSVVVVVIPSPEVTASASQPEICPGGSVNLFSSSPIGTVLPSTLLDENFNSGGAGSRNYSDWSTYYSNYNAAWTTRDDYYSWGRTFRSNDHSRFFLANSRAAGNTNITSTLTSPALNTVGYTSLELKFWHYYRSGGGSDHPMIRVSTDNYNWTTIEELTSDQGNSTGFVQHTVSLNGYIGHSQLYIQFYYSGRNDYYWAIDNVTVTGEGNSADMFWTSVPAGFNSTEQNPTNVSPTETTDYIAWYTDPDTGCLGSDTVTVVVRETPDPVIEADYCDHAPYIRLEAPEGYVSYRWEELKHDGTHDIISTDSYIDVDIAATYTVTVTDDLGCEGSASFNTATELVVNGDFEMGPTPEARATFFTDYGFREPSGSLGGGLYGIGRDARPYYHTFRGAHDHTSGDGYYMIVDGTSSDRVVWQQTITVEPNTNYYFSAWAMNIYLISPTGYNPHLQFSINGQLIGTDVLLNEWTNSDDNPWLDKFRFWGEWNSGTETTAVVQIRDLETSYNQNDFGLDDISFGTLDPSPATPNPSTGGDICEGGTLELFANIENGREPITYLWTGPNGFSSTEENPTITNLGLDGSGTYKLQVWDAYGCDNLTDSIEVTISANAIVDAGEDQLICSDNPVAVLDGSITGVNSTGIWTGGNGSFSPNNRSLNASYYPTAAEIAAGYVELTLTDDNPQAPCLPQQSTVRLTILPDFDIEFQTTRPVCYEGNDGRITATIQGGKAPYSYLWSTGQTTPTITGLEAGIYELTVTDANGCVKSNVVEVENPGIFRINIPSFVVPSCYGGSDGEATISAEGGTPPYQFIWDESTGYQNSATATGLKAGTYSVIVVSDANGCNAATTSVTIPEPAAPSLSCPASFSVQVDEGEAYASNVTVPEPTYSANCQDLVYVMSGATTGTDSGVVPSPGTFNVGTTTITYYATNLKNETLECSFNINVYDVPPVIDCADPIELATETDQCDASATIDFPQVDAGSGISWSWTMTGATTDNGTGAIPSPYTFNKGTTTINWIATNGAGSANCSQTITVNDEQAPEFTSPADFEICVDPIVEFTHTQRTIPDYFLFEQGDTNLDLDRSLFTDNCSCAANNYTIEWRIVFEGGSTFPASGYHSGQPSTYSNGGSNSFEIPGNSAAGLSATHTIYYRVSDCDGNTSEEQHATITITPRPAVMQIN